MRMLAAAMAAAMAAAAASSPAAAQGTARVELNAAVLPGARTGVVGQPTTVFATLANSGAAEASACRIGLDEGFTGAAPVRVDYQTTDAANQLTGSPNTPVAIPARSSQTFLVTLTPTAPLSARLIGLDFRCGTDRATIFSGVNTLRLTAAATASEPDIIPILATPSADGVVRISSGGGSQVMAAAAINIGAAATLNISADTGDYWWPASVVVCETEATGTCKAPPAPAISSAFAPGAVKTFSAFVTSRDGGVPFLPDIARVFLRFRTPSEVEAAAASAALEAAPVQRPLRPLDAAGAANAAFASGARAVLVQRDGATLYEAYSGRGGVDVAEVLNSGTKSFSCGLLAGAVSDRLFNPEDLIGSVIPTWGPGGGAPQNAVKQTVRGIDALTLASGIPGGPIDATISDRDSYAEALGASSLNTPGVAALYGRNGFQLFAAFFQAKTGGVATPSNDVTGGEEPDRYLIRRVLDPIGARIAAWGRDLDGHVNMSAEASVTARDWAKYGRLILDDGVWNGARILTANAVRRCLHHRTPAFYGYGVSFWTNRDWDGTYGDDDSLPGVVTQNGGRMFPSMPEDVAAAWGAGNQQLLLIPSERLVVVKFGGTINTDDFLGRLFAD